MWEWLLAAVDSNMVATAVPIILSEFNATITPGWEPAFPFHFPSFCLSTVNSATFLGGETLASAIPNDLE